MGGQRTDAAVIDVFDHHVGAELSRLPGEDGMDGFYYALLTRDE